jgi:hypothetical protein
MVCTVSGCTQKHYAHGLCNRHYQRLRTHGSTLETVPERRWAGARKSRYVAISGPQHNEHRLKAEQALGHPLPKGVEVHHFDGDGRNNDGNLVICQNKAYHKLLEIRQRIRKLGGNPDIERWCYLCKSLRPLDRFWIRSNGLYAAGCKDCRWRRK